MGVCPLLRPSLLCLLLAGPAFAQSTPTVLDPGPSPDDPIAATKLLAVEVLVDPDSATYRFLGVHPARCKAGWAKGGKDWIGYAAQIDINAKNRMGGYTGYSRYTVLFQGQQAWKAIEGKDFGPYGPAKGVLGLGGGAGVCHYLDL